nr:unnamed protein product [Digitaria exilis]
MGLARRRNAVHYVIAVFLAGSSTAAAVLARASGGNVCLSAVSVQCAARRSGPIKAGGLREASGGGSKRGGGCRIDGGEHLTIMCLCKVKRKFTIAATVQENKTMAATKDDVDHLPIYKLDPKLEKFKDHFSYRMTRYLDQKCSIEKNEGSLEEFSKGYLKFGINTYKDGTVYREWAPAAQEAQLIGDFNDWNGANHNMEKDKFGVWSIKIDHVKGKPAIPHNSRVKFRFRHGGAWVDRIPAWIRYATVDASKFGAAYDGVHWDPPASERYVFKHPRPSKPDAPRIYEAHVGMSGEKPAVSTYREFADNVLPRIRANNYNTVQLMAIMEHSYYASFGYHVTNFFAVSSRSGTPEDLKYLVDKAHSLGLRVLMDVVHSHASNNVTDGLNGYDVGQSTQESYFHTGDRGYHKLWDSRLFNYANWEVLRFLLSNLRYWMDEFMFDGFRFDGVTSMLYHHHGINVGFTGNYKEYFSLDTDVDAVVYMMLANHLMHKLLQEATIVAEDVSGMPVLCRPVDEGGVGFDYRLAMAIPDRWIDYLKNKDDSEWSMGEIAHTLTNRRYTEKCIAYAESHDQSIVGDKTIAFLLMDKEMYTGMSDLQPASPTIDRGIALQKMIHFITMALGGDGYLNFMGNEVKSRLVTQNGLTFQETGTTGAMINADVNGVLWTLITCGTRFNYYEYSPYMNAFDQAMNALDGKFSFLSSSKQIVSDMNEEQKVVVFERGELVFVFNFHPKKTYEGYKVGCDLPGKYRVVLDSDALVFGGHGRAYYRVDEETERLEGKAETFGAGKTSPGTIDVDASPVKTATAATKEREEITDGKVTSGGKKDDSIEDVSGKTGKKFGRQSSDQSTK